MLQPEVIGEGEKREIISNNKGYLEIHVIVFG
jgi:hypothetical protein